MDSLFSYENHLIDNYLEENNRNNTLNMNFNEISFIERQIDPISQVEQHVFLDFTEDIDNLNLSKINLNLSGLDISCLLGEEEKMQMDGNDVNKIIIINESQADNAKNDDSKKSEIKLNKSKSNFTNNTKNSTKSSSNNNNIFQEKSVIYNNKTKFKVLKSLKIPENFNEINLKLDMSCHNLYYKKKKEKIKKKIKEDYKVKDIKMENYEKPLIREFKRFITTNLKKYKSFIDKDKLFWDLFLGKKNENYKPDEKEYKRKKFQKYNQKFIHYLFRRDDIREIYNNEFKEHCKHKKIKSKTDTITYRFYYKYFDDLYKEEVSDINFEIE